MERQLPLIVVLGATACGKSKLAIELARRFSGEIISADSMQVYKGLDIVTNKVTEEEQSLAKHHMISFLDPTQRYSVVDYRDKALGIISSLFDKKSLPIVVGGTNYYIESLLWKNFILGPISQSISKVVEGSSSESNNDKNFETLIDAEVTLLRSSNKDLLHTEQDLADVDKFFKKTIYNDGFPNVESKKLWEILKQVDERSANFYHPNDKRRIIRCLQIVQEKKKNYFELLDDVNKSSEEGKNSLGGPLRFNNTCVFWLQCEKEMLHKVLDERVDHMIEIGLLDELEVFHKNYNQQRLKLNEKPDYEKGLFQSIGFKEFHNYLMLDVKDRNTEKGKEILKQSIVNMKVSTRRYAKKQEKWIKYRLLTPSTRDLPMMVPIKACFDDKWEDEVLNPVIRIIENLISPNEAHE